MPTPCCVPESRKKRQRKDDGIKVSYFKFPTKNPVKKKMATRKKRRRGNALQGN